MLETQIKLMSDRQKIANEYQTLNQEMAHYQAKLIEHQEALTNFEPNIQRMKHAHDAKICSRFIQHFMSTILSITINKIN